MAVSFGSGMALRPSPAARPPVFGADGLSCRDRRFLQQAVDESRSSKDPSTQVGAVITNGKRRVLSRDYNHFPPGIDETDPSRWERPQKYDWVGHAERNAVYAAARKGTALEGGNIYVNLFPCIDCAKAIVSSGIDEVTTFKPDFDHPRWGDDFRFAKELFEEAGVTLNLVSKSEL